MGRKTWYTHSNKKYGNREVEVDGHRFASATEAMRYQDLKLLEEAGVIEHLKLQTKYDLIVNGMNVGAYTADFVYVENDRVVVEDVKGVKTPVYRLKKKLMKAIHNIDIYETTYQDISR